MNANTMSKLVGNERRKHPRYEVHVSAKFVCYDKKDNPLKLDIGLICDISRGGMLIETCDEIIGCHIKFFLSPGLKSKPFVAGERVYSIRLENNLYKNGIVFKDTPENIQLFYNTVLGRNKPRSCHTKHK